MVEAPQLPPNAELKPALPSELLRTQAGGTRPGEDLLSLTVAVVAICGPAHLERCLTALDAQVGAPRFEVLVIHDPALDGIADVCERHAARAVGNAGQRTPLELASRAIKESAGDLILLTEDHCIPAPDWVARLRAAQHPGRAVVGGRVEVRPGVSAVDWAFYFVDFFRYSAPVVEGPSPSLTVCNASYKRAELEQVRDNWEVYFHETAVNARLHERFGDLWLTPDSLVQMHRHVTFAEALRERYAFGRLFGCTRLEFCGLGKRLFYCLFAPTLPLILMGRMTRKGLSSRTLRAGFLRSSPVLAALALAWSWGEWLGYLTRREPRSLIAAQELHPPEI